MPAESTTPAPSASDRNVEAVILKHRQRAARGLEKYGVTTERTDLTTPEWFQHCQDELMDAAVYLEVLMGRLSLLESATRPAPGTSERDHIPCSCGDPGCKYDDHWARQREPKGIAGERERAGKGEAKEPRLCYPFSRETCRIPGCSCRADKAADASRPAAPGDEAAREAAVNEAERIVREGSIPYVPECDSVEELEPHWQPFLRQLADALLLFRSRFPRPADTRERGDHNATATRIVDEGFWRQDWGTDRFRRSIADALEQASLERSDP